MRRRLFNIASAVSLLLCVGLLATDIYAFIIYEPGWLVLMQHPVRIVGLSVVYQMVLAILPALWYREHFRRLRVLRRRTLGDCGCGYNLTGNTSGTCPECGTAITWSRV